MVPLWFTYPDVYKREAFAFFFLYLYIYQIVYGCGFLQHSHIYEQKSTKENNMIYRFLWEHLSEPGNICECTRVEHSNAAARIVLVLCIVYLHFPWEERGALIYSNLYRFLILCAERLLIVKKLENKLIYKVCILYCYMGTGYKLRKSTLY